MISTTRFISTLMPKTALVSSSSSSLSSSPTPPARPRPTAVMTGTRRKCGRMGRTATAVIGDRDR